MSSFELLRAAERRALGLDYHIEPSSIEVTQLLALKTAVASALERRDEKRLMFYMEDLHILVFKKQPQLELFLSLGGTAVLAALLKGKPRSFSELEHNSILLRETLRRVPESITAFMLDEVLIQSLFDLLHHRYLWLPAAQTLVEMLSLDSSYTDFSLFTNIKGLVLSASSRKLAFLCRLFVICLNDAGVAAALSDLEVIDRLIRLLKSKHYHKLLRSLGTIDSSSEVDQDYWSCDELEHSFEAAQTFASHLIEAMHVLELLLSSSLTATVAPLLFQLKLVRVLKALGACLAWHRQSLNYAELTLKVQLINLYEVYSIAVEHSSFPSTLFAPKRTTQVWRQCNEPMLAAKERVIQDFLQES
jgi:hypothetical protein